MKWRFVASVCLLSAGVMPAAAADLPARPEPYVQREVVRIYDWNGFYIGANGGYSLGTTRTNFSGVSALVGAATPTGTVFDGRPSGGVYGVQAGYNWHTSNILIGIEADWQGTSENDTVTCTAVCTPAASIKTQLPWFATTRGRFGWASDRWIAYATLGAAFGQLHWTGTQPGIYSFDSRINRVGWTVGGGVEYGITDNISAKAEYLYIDFSDVSRNFTSFAGAGDISLLTRWHDNIFRGGVNYRFAPAPVVVRY